MRGNINCYRTVVVFFVVVFVIGVADAVAFFDIVSVLLLLLLLLLLIRFCFCFCFFFPFVSPPFLSLTLLLFVLVVDL